MSDIIRFDFKGAGLRVGGTPEEPLFVASDVCAALEVVNVGDALTRLDEDEVGSTDVIDSIGRTQSVRAVTESGLYALVLGSRKPEAKAFKRWVTHEVLPQIRRTGRFEDTKGVLHPLVEADKAAALVERYTRVLESLGGIDVKDAFALRDLSSLGLAKARKYLSGITSTDPVVDMEPKTVCEVLHERGMPQKTATAIAVGRIAARLYREAP